MCCFKIFKKEDEQTFKIFDDMICAEIKDKWEDRWMIYKIKIKGVRFIFISQSYYKTNKLIRQNCSYIALRSIGSKRHLIAILHEYGLGIVAEKY